MYKGTYGLGVLADWNWDNQSRINIFEGSRKKLYKTKAGSAVLYNASYSTLKASGGNDIICVLNNTYHAVVQGGAGNDYITNYNGGEYCSFYGEKGDDEFRICKEGTYADGGADNDTFHIFGENPGRTVEDATLVGGDGDDVFEFVLSSKVSIEGGTGKNIYRFDPFAYSTYAHNDVVITDISDDDTIEYFADWGNMGKEKSDGTELGWSIDSDSGFVVLYDENWDFFNVTLEGVTDISEVAAVKYNATKGGTKTLGEIFKIPGGGKVKLNSSGTKATILDTYTDKNFKMADYGSKLKTVDGSAASQDLYITANGLANKIIGSDFDDTIDGGKGNDILTGGEGADVFVYKNGDGKNTILDYDEEDKIKIASGTLSDISVSGDDLVLTVGKGSITIKKGADKEITIVDSKGKEKIYPDDFKQAVSLNASGTAAELTDIYEDESFYFEDHGKKLKTVDASAVQYELEIVGNTLANAITGTDYDDTISGGAGNDKIWGGDGSDVFVYSAGKDVINDYKAGEDTIQIDSNEKISKATVSGSDVVFTIGKGTLTIKNAKAKKISMMDSAGKEYVTMVGGATTSNVTDSTKSSFKIDTWIKTVNATKRTKTIKITGNTLANSISGGTNKDTIYGGDGNDTLRGNKGNDKLYGQVGADKIYGGAGKDSLWGGKGNDSLWGDAGADVFYYEKGDGKDTIYGFENSDMLKITGTFSTPTYNKSKKEVYFKVDSTANAITLKDFTASTFNVNGTNYKISGTKLVKK